jgi:hypothetical protein
MTTVTLRQPATGAATAIPQPVRGEYRVALLGSVSR